MVYSRNADGELLGIEWDTDDVETNEVVVKAGQES